MIYPIDFPRAPATERLILTRRQSATESSWTFKTQVVHTASRWTLEWTWPRVTFREAESLTGWLVSLRGQIGTFRYFPRQAAASTLSGRTLALATFAYSTTIKVAGWTVAGDSNLRVGQYFSIGDQLLRIVDAPTTADGIGNVTFSFEPELRADVAISTAVNFSAPSGVFRLASADGYGYTLDPDRTPDFGSLAAVEVV